MDDNSTAVSPSNSTSHSPTGPSTGQWFYLVSGLIDHALGIPANIWSLYVIVTGGGRRWSLVESEITTLNLVTMEIGSALCFILSLINQFSIISNSLLKALSFPFALVLSGRALFQSLICVERYLAVVHPVVFLRYKPLRYRLACCGLVWLLALGYAGLYCFLFHGYTLVSSINIILLVLFITLLSIDLFCSLSILRVLRQPGPGDRGREMKDGGKEEKQTARCEERGKGERAVERGMESPMENGKNQQKRRAFRIVSFMIGMLVFNSVPLMVGSVLQKAFGNRVFEVEVFPVALSLSQMGSCVQALLHLHRAGRLPCLTSTTRGRQQNN